MQASALSLRSFYASLLLVFTIFLASCGNDKGKVEGVNMLYGTDSKVWKSAKELDASGDKVKQTAEQKREELHVFANKTYIMTGAAGAASGTYEFDQAAKKLTLTPQGAATSNVFTVETLTDDKLTLVAPSGAKLMLETE